MRYRTFGGVGALCLLAACAAGPAPRSGFLGDYSRLERVGSSELPPRTTSPADYDLRRFRAVMIEPTDVQVEGLDDRRERQKLSAAFREALVERLNGALPVTDQTGPGVLRVRTAIVEARKANVAVNAVTTSLLLMPVTQGGVAAEAEVVDGGCGNALRRYLGPGAVQRSPKSVSLTPNWGRRAQDCGPLRAVFADLFDPPAPEAATGRRP